MHSSSIYQDYLCEYLFGEDGLLKISMTGKPSSSITPERMQIYCKSAWQR